MVSDRVIFELSDFSELILTGRQEKNETTPELPVQEDKRDTMLIQKWLAQIGLKGQTQ
jgi:hypothetical protein